MIDKTKIDEAIQAKLQKTEEDLKEAIALSLQAISNSPEDEKDILELWISYGRKVSDFFLDEAERTGNERVGKNLIKYFMFK